MLLLVLILLLIIIKFLRVSLVLTFENKNKSVKYFIVYAFGLLLWLLFLAVISRLNFLDKFSAMPPHMLVVILPPLIFAIVLFLSKPVLRWLHNVPLQNLIYIQTFRVAVELILWLLYRNRVIPVQMTFEGCNYDILVGLSALFTAYYFDKGYEFFKNRWVLIIWNVAGLILLGNIVIVAILSTPLPFRQFMNEPANTVIFYFPFVLLPGFLVPVAYTMHLLCLKKLLAKNLQ